MNCNVAVGLRKLRPSGLIAETRGFLSAQPLEKLFRLLQEFRFATYPALRFRLHVSRQRLPTSYRRVAQCLQ
jgi:hypothetical protein